MYKSFVYLGRPQTTIWHTSVKLWIPESTNTHSVCVIRIAFTLQQCLYEVTSMLVCTNDASLPSFLSIWKSSDERHTHFSACDYFPT